MARKDDVMVADGVLEEVACILGPESEAHLRAAEVLAVLVVQQFPFRDEMTLQVAGDLEDGDRSLRENAVDAHADAGLEVRVELPVFHQVERDGAVCEEDAAGFHVDLRRIRLEAGQAGEGMGDHHRQERRDIAFATGRNVLRIEAGQRQAAGVADRGQEVEAA